ncbi:ABC transporter permease [Dyella subtropica]|uniref:ABC transporter permease n=1 Tax=Dyella subtropica TaxID=2992127 RepID=UPI0022597506|nr:FtsX-like permease family protein [Dyella subtropica]
MEIRPILASLRKHRIPALLIMLEIALACAVLCNAVFMIGQRVTDIHLPNAIDEDGISVVTVNGADPKLAGSDIPRNLAALRGIAGVTAVAAVTSMPLDQNPALSPFTATPDAKSTVNTSVYFIGSGGEQALGLHLLEGRYFNADEYADSGLQDFHSTGHVALVTQSDAHRLWPGQSALGKTLYTNATGWTVVGVVADMLAQDPKFNRAEGRYSSVFFPLHPDAMMGDYVVRSAQRDRERVVRDAAQVLDKLQPGAVVEGKTYAGMRDEYFATTNSMVWMLVLVCVVMLAVTAFGIVGLTSFWVGQRRRQIGIRRAVGATRGHIMQYFQTENFLLSTAGVVMGMAMAFGINLYLMRHYEMMRMPWYYLPGSAVALWVVGQLAVFGPARRAAAVPPVVATRSA